MDDFFGRIFLVILIILFLFIFIKHIINVYRFYDYGYKCFKVFREYLLFDSDIKRNEYYKNNNVKDEKNNNVKDEKNSWHFVFIYDIFILRVLEVDII